jgi:DNA-binding NtrC family response regulator
MKNLKVMVVDDNSKIIFAFHTLLEKENCLLIEAASGAEAIRKFKAGKPKAVFLDISLPDADGLDVLKKIRKKNPSIPVIIITGIGSSELRTRALQLGAYDYLEKPLSVNHIRDILNRIKKPDRISPGKPFPQ